MSLQSTVFPFCEPTLSQTHFSSCIPHSETAFLFFAKIRFTHENIIFTIYDLPMKILFLHVTSKIEKEKLTKSAVIKLVNVMIKGRRE